MKIVSLNIRHGGGPRIAAIVEYLVGTNADVLAVTEFRLGKTGEALTKRLSDAGYPHQHWTVAAPRQNAVLLAARRPFAPIDLKPPEDHKHRLISARVGDVEVWAVYMALGKDKVPLYEYLLQQRPSKTILLGDFNTGRHYHDESGATFIAADRFEGLQTSGWIDLWRRQHGAETREFTWLSRIGNGFRIDHAFASADLTDDVRDCRYDHTTRPTLTDHSAMSVEIAMDR